MEVATLRRYQTNTEERYMTDLFSMTPRELVRGLMRGEAVSHKLGYTPAAAVESVATIKRQKGEAFSGEERTQLLAYAEGFASGMLEEGQLPALKAAA